MISIDSVVEDKLRINSTDEIIREKYAYKAAIRRDAIILYNVRPA